MRAAVTLPMDYGPGAFAHAGGAGGGSSGLRVFGPFEKIVNLPGIHQAIQFLGLFSGTAEALPKLAVESLLAKRGLPQWERDRLARLEGIPNTGLSAGKFGTYANLVSLFYRVWVQGTRRLATLPFHRRTRGMWWTGNLLGLGLIKGFYAAAAAGFIDALAGGSDDEERQVDWKEAYARISPYWKVARTSPRRRQNSAWLRSLRSKASRISHRWRGVRLRASGTVARITRGGRCSRSDAYLQPDDQRRGDDPVEDEVTIGLSSLYPQTFVGMNRPYGVAS